MTDEALALDELLDRAVEAIDAGDVETARLLAGTLLVSEEDEDEGDWTIPADGAGELRRLTMVFCDLVGSTALSARHPPEVYRAIVGRYLRTCRTVIEDRYDGYVANIKGDGLLVLFGFPVAHENDAERAVQAALDLVDAVRALSVGAPRGEQLNVRVAVHKGIVYLDRAEAEVYGLAANLAARLHELAQPGTIVVSDEMRMLIGHAFELDAQERAQVKGIDAPLQSWRVVGEQSRPSGTRRTWLAPLIGRAAVQEELSSMWARRPANAALIGPPGVGKTRLAQWMLEQVRVEGATHLELAGSASYSRIAYSPVQRAIEAACGIERATPAAERLRLLRDHLETIGLGNDATVALLAPLLDLDPRHGYEPHPSDAGRLRDYIAAAVTTYVIQRLSDSPGLLLIEDVHWFDDATTQVILRLAASPPRDTLLLLTMRPGTRIANGPWTQMEVAPLDEADAADLVDALAPTDLGPAARSAILDRAEGIPLYLEELVRSSAPAAVPNVPPSTTSPPGDIPEVLYESLVARLYEAPDGADVAMAASTLGREVDLDVLARLVGSPGAELGAVVERLIHAQVLERMSRPGWVRFRHQLLQEVAYGLLPPGSAQRLHAAAADALLDAMPGTLIEWNSVSDHLLRAGRGRAAAAALEHAAGRARRTGQLQECRDHLDRAIAVLPAGTPALEVRLRLGRGFFAVSIEGNASPSASLDYERCMELALADPGSDEMFSTLISLWAFYSVRAELARAEKILEALRTVCTGERQWFLPQNLAGFGVLDWYRGDFEASHNRLEEAVAAQHLVAAEHPPSGWSIPNDQRVSMQVHLGLARFMRGDPAGAEEALGQGLDRAERLHFPEGPFSAAYAGIYGAWMSFQCGELTRARQRAERVAQLAADHGFEFWALTAATQQTLTEARAALEQDPPEVATAAATLGAIGGLVMLWEALGARVFLPSVQGAAGGLLLGAGDPDSARAMLTACLDAGAATGVQFYAAETRRLLAGMIAEPEGRRSELRTAWELACSQGAVPFQLRCALDLLDNGDDDAPRLLERVLAAFAPDASYPELDRARARLGGR